MTTYTHLGRFSDWADFTLRQSAAGLREPRPKLTPAQVREVLRFAEDRAPADAVVETTWSRDGVDGEEVSWSVGYGPRTHAWLLRPAGERGPLPGVLALHDHSNFKLFGKEKIADGPRGPHPLVAELRRVEYGGTAFANELARQGFAVLAHDAFLWGSRSFSLEEMRPHSAEQLPVPWLPPEGRPQSGPPQSGRAQSGRPQSGRPQSGRPQSGRPQSGRPQSEPAPAGGGPLAPPDDDQVREHNRAAVEHEHVVAKYCTLLGTSLAGVVAYEDRAALAYMRSRPDVAGGGIGCIGLSGGGCRAALLQATSADIGVSVIVCMMSTYAHLLDRHVVRHTWMLFPPGLSGAGDWPDLAACRAPSPLVVQYARDDDLFSLPGMQAAHGRIAAAYADAGAPSAYEGRFFDGGHAFDPAMQKAAFAQLTYWLGRPGG